MGSPFAGRERLETEALIGFFANTLPLRTNLDGNPSFSEALQRVRETVVEAQGHSDMPLEKMVAGAAEQRDLSRSSIFQVVFGLQGDFVEGWSLPKTKTTRLELETGTAKFDWTILATESKAGLRFRSEFSTDLFKGETISRLMRQLQVLVEGILENPNQRIGELRC